ncbi:hypothetical protein PUN28_013969 [Cardiocondyla obscurior]|uniref:Secreted protein n=1 Tax=Cardiocondyla obscurior TaxID=286306 RepID=A0AAW2F637_9HYME
MCSTSFVTVKDAPLRVLFALAAVFTRRVVVYGESNGEGNEFPRDFKNSSARRTMNIALLLTFRSPYPSVIFLNSARFSV